MSNNGSAGGGHGPLLRTRIIQSTCAEPATSSSCAASRSRIARSGEDFPTPCHGSIRCTCAQQAGALRPGASSHAPPSRAGYTPSVTRLPQSPCVPGVSSPPLGRNALGRAGHAEAAAPAATGGGASLHGRDGRRASSRGGNGRDFSYTAPKTAEPLHATAMAGMAGIVMAGISRMVRAASPMSVLTSLMML